MHVQNLIVNGSGSVAQTIGDVRSYRAQVNLKILELVLPGKLLDAGDHGFRMSEPEKIWMTSL